MNTLLVLPPFTQINTVYPSISQLSGFLQSQNIDVQSLDLSIKVIQKVFSEEGLNKIFNEIENLSDKYKYRRYLVLRNEFINVVNVVIPFLQGKDPSLAQKIIQEDFLPKGEFIHPVHEDSDLFGEIGIQDKAKYLASIFIDDLTKLIQLTITEHFGLSRYAEKISSSTADFTKIEMELNRNPNLIEEIIIDETNKALNSFQPEIIGFSIPFPGNLLGALISAKHIKSINKDIKIVFGGGYVNTELKDISDPAIFNYIDYLTFNDGELPILNIIQNQNRDKKEFVRTMIREKGKIKYFDNAELKNIHHKDVPAPSLKGLNVNEYISMTEMANPMHRLWSDGFWNKITAAHGCYWRKCTFCDVNLDYIGRYSPGNTKRIVDWMEDLIAQTGKSSFHFTDEAAPPFILRDIALEIIKRKLNVVWWGNIRFEKSFTSDLCKLLSKSGCIAVSGGIEVADKRLLKLINKGVTIEQTANVCNNFNNSGIMVHAYLMYGFPTQTEQETINSLEIVRQFFIHDLFQSAFWHLFTLTIHSPVAADPEFYKIRIDNENLNPFGNNDLKHTDLKGCDHSKFTDGLNKALYNYMHGIGLDMDVVDWFDFKVPKTNINKNLLHNSISSYNELVPKGEKRALWLRGKPIFEFNESSPVLLVIDNHLEAEWEIDKKTAKWLKQNIYSIIEHPLRMKFDDLQNTYPGSEKEFREFLNTDLWIELREHFLIFL